jgi:signal transduction histidine kinase
LIHASDELGFMNEACRILVEDGGYCFAWVGFAELDQEKTVRPVAQKGFEDGYLETANITWADTERGRGPTGKAIRTKKPCIARNIIQDPDFAPWRKAASERGYASSIALPFIAENRSVGALNIYANEPDAFDAEEVRLLSNLADDLSYGLMSLRAKAELRRLSAQLISIQETERKAISRELHDSIGQSLVAIKFGLENTLEKMRQGMDQESLELLEALVPLVQQSGEEVRRIHTDLRPSLLDDLGILATISWFCRQFEKVYSDIRVEKQIEIEENHVRESLKIVIFRILQEALNNVAKYSEADLVGVSLSRTEDRLEFAVQDNGQGFDPQIIYSLKTGDSGVGIANMKERAELSGGSFSIESSPGSGATVRVSWPNEGNKST